MRSRGHILRVFVILSLILATVAGPWSALRAEEKPPCCCGDVCYMDCARDSSGVDRHFGGDHDERPDAAWRPLGTCSSDSPALAVGSSPLTLVGPERRPNLPPPSSLSLPDPRESEGSRTFLFASSASPRGPPLLF